MNVKALELGMASSHFREPQRAARGGPGVDGPGPPQTLLRLINRFPQSLQMHSLPVISSTAGGCATTRTTWLETTRYVDGLKTGTSPARGTTLS
jgi:D-alanyl-D-alanine carboxypeptidase